MVSIINKLYHIGESMISRVDIIDERWFYDYQQATKTVENCKRNYNGK